MLRHEASRVSQRTDRPTTRARDHSQAQPDTEFWDDNQLIMRRHKHRAGASSSNVRQPNWYSAKMTDLDPNPEQRRAIAHSTGPLRIMAGAGTGKTQTLTDRFVFLIESGIPAHQILAVTFTSKAAQELQQRVLDRLDASYKRLWITTFHGLCRELLKEWNDHAGNPAAALSR